MKIFRSLLPGIFTCVLAALASASAQAQSEASRRPLTLVVPFTAGAANDVLARILAPHLKETFGNVVVENKPGADGAIGAMAVLNAPRDGRTLLVAPDQFVIAAALGQPQPFDFVRDFAPVVRTNNLPFFLVTNPDALPAGSLAEVVAALRTSPGKYTYGSAGNGSPHNLAMLMLLQREKLDLVHIPYKGMAQGVPDLLGGRIQLVITGLPAVSGQLKDGRLRVLATVGSRRAALRPEVPTFAEAGVADVQMDTWQGILAPAGTPKPMIDALNRAINAALARPEVRAQMAAQGMDVAGGTAEAFGESIRADNLRYRELVRAAKIAEGNGAAK